MKQFAVIGNPIGHSLSPSLHNFVYNLLGIDAVYERKRVLTSELPQIINLIKNGDLSGINVTIPHKENIIEYLDNINPRAQSIGAVNIIINNGNKLIGNNTDWFGFLMALKKNRIDPANKEVIVLGAGGTAKAVLFALKQLGVNKIVLLNRTLQKAEELKEDIVFPYPLTHLAKMIKNDSIIINTTPIGMQSAQSPIDLGLIHKNQVLIDIIYTPLKTSILKYGEKIGALTINGLDMFIHQGLASLDLWFGSSVSTQVNLPKLKTYLESELC